MSKNNTLHIVYIWRLEQEKGIEILIECIQRSQQLSKNIIWHICGDGSYMSRIQELEKYEKSSINIYGHIDQSHRDEILKNSDLVLMPSLFLETFGLVALESLSLWVPVCGFALGGLADLIHPDLVLDGSRPVDSFFDIIDRGAYPLIDITQYSYQLWIDRLRDLTDGSSRILLVNDYTTIVWWAEQYIYTLAWALESIGKTVILYGYSKYVSRYMRIWLMCITPIAYWRWVSLNKKIKDHQVDLIWVHSVIRYLGPHSMKKIRDSGIKTYMTHHDLWLITPRPSRVIAYSDIPDSPNLGSWTRRSTISLITILDTTCKWLLVSYLWIYVRDFSLHIVPSQWMQSYFARYTRDVPEIYPHSVGVTHQSE